MGLDQTKPGQFRFTLCPTLGKAIPGDCTKEKIIQCWLDVWSAASRELGTPPPEMAKLLDLDLLGGLFVDDECVAMLGFRFFAANEQERETDPYFSRWSEEAFRAILRDGSRILIACQFSVRPEARRDLCRLRLKDLLSGLAIQTFLASHVDAMAGAVRVDRGMSTTIQGWGGVAVERGLSGEFGERNTDHFAFFSEEVTRAIQAHPLHEDVRALWEESRRSPSDGLSEVPCDL